MNELSIANAEIASALGALAVMVIGLLSARFTQRAIRRSLVSLDGWLSRYSSSDSGWVTPASASAISSAAFWLVVLLAIVISLRMLGVGGISTLLEGIADFVPRILLAMVVVGAGHLLGLLARALVTRMSDSMDHDSHIPRLLHGVILVVAILIALQQLAVNITFITQLVLILVAVFLGGMTLTFALGARTHVANLLGRSELRRYNVGERIRIEDIEGDIVHIHSTGADVSTIDGVVSVPASRFAEIAVLRLSESDDDS
jgi:small-conductance mechanosensitive channel